MRKGSLVAGALALLALAYPSVARADLVVLQESNGFPGTSDGDTARQKVLIAEDKLKLLDRARGMAVLVDLGAKEVHEIYAADKGFVKKKLSDYAEIREKREKTRAENVAQYKQQLEKLKSDSEKANLKRELEKMGLREDGTTHARLETFADETKTVQLVVDGVKQDVTLTRYAIRENEAAQPVFEIWAAPKLPRPQKLLTFYKELGTFSEPVIAELQKLEAFPVEITAVLDDGNNKKTIHSRVYEIREEKVDATEYSVPAGFKAMEAKPQGPAQATQPCAICGKPSTEFFKNPWTGQRYPVCSQEHRSELIQRLAKEQRPRAERPGSETPK